MATFFDTSIDSIAAVLLFGAGAGVAAAGVRTMARGLRRASPLDLVRGIRVLIVGFVAGLAAIAIATAEPGFAIVGAIILAEELYETAALALIIRLGERARETPPGGVAAGDGRPRELAARA